MKEELLKGLSEDQIQKVKACKNKDELLKLAKEDGIELTDEQLSAVSGGGLCQSTPTFTCPECGSQDVKAVSLSGPARAYWSCTCKSCNKEWHEY